MADWKQITARIRRARTSKDPAGQLSNLYEKTHDAMAAFELARYFETTGNTADAGKWYAAAADRFRRADWKSKAQEAAVRLGVTPSGLPSDPQDATFRRADDFILTPPPVAVPDPPLPSESSDASGEAAAVPSPLPAETAGEASASPQRKTRRRGRRGGRNRRKPGAAAGLTPAPLENAALASSAAPVPHRGASRSSAASETRQSRVGESRPSIPPLPVEAPAEGSVAGLRGRYGDPGLSSRLTQLEMHFRRLLTCEPAKLDEADRAPVGPGVFVLTDSDLTTYYYVESCQTLRIAVANLLRGGSSRRGAESIKPQLADHLGIPETRVAKYLADHCVVRWLQLDEGASHFAHFVIAVLRPILND
jgi:hypothetical protein